MRIITRTLCGLIVILLLVAVPTGQRAATPKVLGGLALGLPAPSDTAVDYAAADLDAAFKEAAAQNVYAFRVLEGGTFNMNIRGQFAAEESARVHTNIHDLYMVRNGEATFVTGGELVDPKKSGAEGTELNGASIRNGVSRAIKPGDVIFVPAGVPHQVTAVNGRLQFLLVRWQQVQDVPGSRGAER
jgi:mannose-6-phosphate isomerase-like protein (cupin superfamily)